MAEPSCSRWAVAGVHYLLIGASQIEGTVYLAGYYITGGMCYLQCANRCYHRLQMAGGKPFHFQNEFRSSAQRIVAHMHGNSTGMAGFAFEGEGDSFLSGNSSNNSNRNIFFK